MPQTLKRYSRLTLQRLAVALLIFAAATTLQPALAEPVRILPLGDSWTEGYGHHVGYRYDLWYRLIDAGFEVDFVGPKTFTADGPDLDLYPLYQTTFDRDHAGYSGYRTDELISPGRSSAARFDPHIVLLWAGGNDIDMQGAAGVINARNGLRDIIAGLRAEVPEVIVLLGRAHHYNGRGRDHIPALNEAIAGIASEMDTPMSPVVLVEHSEGFDFDTMMQRDGVHHNRNGEAWVAANWFEALQRILPDVAQPAIDSTYSGAWFNPETPGQGQLIEAEPDDEFLFMAWFSFWPEGTINAGQQHWFTAQGPFSGNEASLTVYETVGGGFDSALPVTTEPVGTALMSFRGCNEGQLDYTIDHWDLVGSIPIERVIPGSASDCEAPAEPRISSTDINAGMDGAWFDPDKSGQGFLIDVNPDPDGGNFIFVAWFTYGDETASGQRWLTAQGPFEGPNAELTIYETTGGWFADPQVTETVPVGTMTIEFNDCNSATLGYSLPDDELEGEIDISRLLRAGSATCESLTQ